MTGKAKRARQARLANARSYAVPDSVLQAASKSGELDTSISANDADSGTMTNLTSVGAAQQSALQIRLDSAANTGGLGESTQATTSGTATSVDPKGYLTSLQKNQLQSDEVSVEDVNRARVLLESAVKSNVSNGYVMSLHEQHVRQTLTSYRPGYVALARLEELAGKLHTARKTIHRATEQRPRSIVVWKEAIRLNRESVHNAKIIAANGIKLDPKVGDGHQVRQRSCASSHFQAVQLWQAAIDLEDLPAARRKVARQALDQNGCSVLLWKTLINLNEDIENVRLLFAKATETLRNVFLRSSSEISTNDT
jgi:pre-mRNA-processing factor 6